MGYIRHHAIIVTGSYHVDINPDCPHWAEKAHDVAVRVFEDTTARVSPVTSDGTNGTRSFFIAPDGSKEGWDASDAGDQARTDFIIWLEGQRYADGSTPLAWVEVQYGDDDCETEIVRDSDAARRAARAL